MGMDFLAKGLYRTERITVIQRYKDENMAKSKKLKDGVYDCNGIYVVVENGEITKVI
jgi:hypothetical protein